MMILCYQQGALGHAVNALIDCCTKEGNNDFPLFSKNQNLHHYKSKTRLVGIVHPDCDVALFQQRGYVVISSTSKTFNGRLLVILMGLAKWFKKLPEFNNPIKKLEQFGDTFGEQIEILSASLTNLIKNESEWFSDANHTFDILNFWNDVQSVITFLKDIGLTPVNELVHKFCRKITYINQMYYNSVQKCVSIANNVINREIVDIDISFYEVAMIHCLLMEHLNRNHLELKLLDSTPKNTIEFINIL